MESAIVVEFVNDEDKNGYFFEMNVIETAIYLYLMYNPIFSTL